MLRSASDGEPMDPGLGLRCPTQPWRTLTSVADLSWEIFRLKNQTNTKSATLPRASYKDLPMMSVQRNRQSPSLAVQRYLLGFKHLFRHWPDRSLHLHGSQMSRVYGLFGRRIPRTESRRQSSSHGLLNNMEGTRLASVANPPTRPSDKVGRRREMIGEIRRLL
jgi:hypothetical protein